MLTLFTFLSKYDHEYVVYYDFLNWPYGDKTFDQSLGYVQKWIEYLNQHGVDMIIVPPIYELYLLHDQLSTSHYKNIFPLFTRYVFDYWFMFSHVGKIGLIGDFADIEKAQQIFADLEKQYILHDRQKNIQKFHFPFAYWVKETPLWKYYLTTLSYSHILVNKLLKFDLRYFKDAMVDTIIPLNYWYFHYQTTIVKFLNFKKIRFHNLWSLAHIFHTVTQNMWSSSYAVTILYSWHTSILQREKRLIWLLQRGKSIEIERKKI